jgi:hypothetical protein
MLENKEGLIISDGNSRINNREEGRRRRGRSQRRKKARGGCRDGVLAVKEDGEGDGYVGG